MIKQRTLFKRNKHVPKSQTVVTALDLVRALGTSIDNKQLTKEYVCKMLGCTEQKLNKMLDERLLPNLEQQHVIKELLHAYG